jgi:hypothetical protein
MGIGGCGIQTLAVAFGGTASPGRVGATELWNGSTWTSNPNSLTTARAIIGGAGTQAAGLGFGGLDPSVAVANTEEFTGPGSATTKTVTVT